MQATSAVRPTRVQRNVIITALDNGGRTSSDPYQLRTVNTLVQAGVCAGLVLLLPADNN